MPNGETGGETVVVPRAPGPLIRPRAGARPRHRRDDLDDLIDELLPESRQAPGWFDALLVAGGAGAVGWEVVGTPPTAVAVIGIGALGLGAVLPLQWLWRAAGRRRERAALAKGAALQVSDGDVARLVRAYDRLSALPGAPAEAIAAAHSAMLEVATLLQGEAPRSDRERAYVGARAAAIDTLAAALQSWNDLAPDVVVEAREELDAFGGVGALRRLEQLSFEARRRGPGGPDTGS